jgi:hypothetical protein
MYKHFMHEIRRAWRSGDLTSALFLEYNVEHLEYHGLDLLCDLRRIQPGKSSAMDYQRIVGQILAILFRPDLSHAHLEISNESGISRYDIVFLNKAQSGFWHDLKVTRGNAIVIFDAKNKNNLVPTDADQMLRYSSDWRGNVLFIVCRKPASKSFNARLCELLKEKKVCVLVISDSDLEEMLILKEQGNDPIQVIEKTFMKRIERT